MLTIKKIQKEDILKQVHLFSKCFPENKKFNYEYLNWLYYKNPAGKVLGFNAFYKTKIVAHYALIPSKVFIKGKLYNCLLSLNTATHPDFQKKGLFSKLAMLSIKEAKKNKYEAIYGVANYNSSLGFKKIGFKLLSYLDVLLCTSNRKVNLIRNELDFMPFWNKAFLDWRSSNPKKPKKSRIYST